MTTIEEVTTTVNAYAADQVTKATTELRATLTAELTDAQTALAAARASLVTAQADAASDDATIATLTAQATAGAALVASLQATVADLQARLAAVATAPAVSGAYTQPTTGAPMPTSVAGSSPSLKVAASSTPVLLPSGDLSSYWKDFAEAAGFAGMWWRAAKVFGAGIDKTILGVTANTMAAAKRAVIKALTKGQTNQQYVARIDGATELAGVTLRGTAQGGVNYNGLNIYKGNKGHVHDVATEFIPGSGSAPPDETFHMNDQRCVDELYERIYLRLKGGGSGFGSNMSTRTTVDGFDFSDSSAAAGGAIYKGTDIVLRNGAAKRNAKVGINFEQMAGTNIVENVEFAGNGVDLAFNANQDYKAGALWEIREPKKPLGQPLTMRIGKGGYVDFQNTAADKTQSVTWDMIWLTVDGVRKNVKDWPASVVQLIIA